MPSWNGTRSYVGDLKKTLFLFRKIWPQNVYNKRHFSSVQLSRSVMSDSLRPMNCSTPGLPIYHQLPELLKLMSIELVMPSNHLILWHPLILPSVFPSIRVFSNESALPSGGQSIGVSASASILPMYTQDWSPLGWTGWTSLQSKGLSRVFSNTTVQKHPFPRSQFFTSGGQSIGAST